MVRLLGASAELAQKVVRSTEIANGRLALIGFVNREDNTLVGHLLVEMSPGRYEHVEFPSCDEEGGAPPQRPSLPLAESPGIGYAANEEESATRDVLDGEKEGPIDVHFNRRSCFRQAHSKVQGRCCRGLGALLIERQVGLVENTRNVEVSA